MSEEQYKQYRNTFNYTIKQVKQTYYIDIVTRFENYTTKIWKIINQLSEKDIKTKILKKFSTAMKKPPSETAKLIN